MGETDKASMGFKVDAGFLKLAKKRYGEFPILSFKLMNLKEGDKAIDVGCGIGSDAISMAKTGRNKRSETVLIKTIPRLLNQRTSFDVFNTSLGAKTSQVAIAISIPKKVPSLIIASYCICVCFL